MGCHCSKTTEDELKFTMDTSQTNKQDYLEQQRDAQKTNIPKNEN